MVSGQNRQPVAVKARFDEFNFDLEIQHTGTAIELGIDEAPDVTQLLEADDEVIDSAMVNISMVLVHRLADRVRVGTRDGVSFIALHFDH